MCQAYEVEHSYMLSRDRWTRKKGYDAQKAGVPREANPEQDHPNPEYSDKRQWWSGWDAAAAGRNAW